MKKVWRLMIHPDLPGSRQMAIDETLYRSAVAGSTPVLRFYTWLRPTLSLGYFQDYKKVVCEPFCVHNSIDIVRRMTGGRAVLHQYEMTYSIVAPLENQFANHSLQQTYYLISAALQSGLQELGYRHSSISANPAPGNNLQSGGPQCFVAVSRYEIADGLRKVIGSAQKRSKDRFLQHGSILLNFDQRLQNGCVLHPDPGILEKIAPLELSLKRSLEFSELYACFTRTFERSFQVTAERSDLTMPENDLTENLQHKYQSQEWTLDRWK